MILKAVIATIVCGVTSLWALTGTLIDNSGNPLIDASVKLVNANLEVSTDQTGYFTFESSSIRRAGSVMQSYNKPVAVLGCIRFSLSQSGRVNIFIYNLTGAQISSYSTFMSEGDHNIPIAQRVGTLADGVYLVRFSAGAQKLMFRYIHNRNLTGFGAVSSRASLPVTSDDANIAKIKIAGAVDTLIISKTVNEVVNTRKVLVFNYNDNINTYATDGKQILIIDPSNDNDGDGLTNFEERNRAESTNSEIADTDGDGIADRQEILDGTNPLIADVPSYSFRIKSYPVLIANFSKSIGGSKERAISSGGEYSKTSTFTTTQELNWNAEIALMLGFAQEYKKDGGFTLNGSVTATLGVGGSISFSQEKSESMSKNWSEALTMAETYEATFEGGTISIDLEFENTSGQDITLVNPMVRLTRNGTLSTTLETLIGELTLEDDLVYGKRILISSAVGNNKTTRTFKASVSNPEVFDLISQMSTGLSARLENIRFETSLGGIDTLMTNVYRRNAQVVIDAGYYSTTGKTISRQYIAKRNVYNEFYTSQNDRYVPRTLHQVLASTGAVVEYGITNGKQGIRSIDGLSNGAVTNGSWSVVIQSSTDSLTVYGIGADYDPRTISAGDAGIITVVYSADADGDGLPDRMESALGTAMDKKDSDNDSVSDGNEVFGWKRNSDPVGTLWKTNPLIADTDRDGIGDFTDPDPLTEKVNPLDSTVAITSLVITPAQGTAWTQNVTAADSVLTYPVSGIMRGRVKLTFECAHPVRSLVVFRQGAKDSTDTVIVQEPDMGKIATYSALLPLKLGINSISVLAMSKNGTLVRKIHFTGIDRRLVQVNASATDLFRVSLPAGSKIGIGADIYVDVDKILEMDPLITSVFLLRTDVFGCPVDNNDKNKKMTAENLGDSGNGDANVKAGMQLFSKASNPNSYTVVEILNSGNRTITNSDSTTKRINDYVYFPYTAHADAEGGKNYYTASSTGTGIYLSNERRIIIDSIRAVMAPVEPYTYVLGIPVHWQFIVQPRLTFAGTEYSGQSNWQEQGENNPKIITLVINREMNINDSLICKNFQGDEGWFRGNNSGIWDNYLPTPPPLTYLNVAYPKLYAIQKFIWGELMYGQGELYKRTHWYTESETLGGSRPFKGGFEVFWRYKFNHPAQ